MDSGSLTPPQKLLPVNGIEINYDTIGDPANPALLLIAGLSMPLIGWDVRYCRQLADSGFYLIRFDNRDVGLSTQIDDAGMVDIQPFMPAMMGGSVPEPPYTLADMADDAIGLLDALGIEKAHLLGVSLGGMIAQTAAINHPNRVKSLISIMSTTMRPGLAMPTQDALALLAKPPAASWEEYQTRQLQAAKILNGPYYPVEEEVTIAIARAMWRQGITPAGSSRQLAAGLGSGSRHEALRAIDTPTLVIHGDADPLIPVDAGKDTAAAISNAELLILEGVGHALPQPVWNEVIEAITTFIQQRASNESVK